MLSPGTHLFNKTKNLSYRVCEMSLCGKRVAIADMVTALAATNVSKPFIKSALETKNWIKELGLEIEFYKLPAVMTFTDNQLITYGHEKWIKKRDKKWARIQMLCGKETINAYLFGQGIHPRILEEMEASNLSKGAYYHSINRYITFGMTKNALLPFKLENVGSTYLHIETPNDTVIKRGRGRNDNSKSKSKTRGITNLDKKYIAKVAAHCKSRTGKFSLSYAYNVYMDTYARTEIKRIQNGEEQVALIPYPIEDCISQAQFNYHFKKVVSPERLIRTKVGDLIYQKDFADKQGSAIDGVLGATHRYEIDSTVLDVYVRYPFDKTKCLSMGRPVLTIVVDTFSTAITGFYLGFSGPDANSVAQALVNACLDKVEFASRYGVQIEKSDWPMKHIPYQLTVDNGTEYPNNLIQPILKSQLGIEAANFTAVYRGDAKGTVEGVFNILNNEFIHHEPGSIFKKTDRTEQHPSNTTMYDYDQLMARLIHQIIFHNKSAERLRKFNWQAVYDDIGVSPNDLFLHSVEADMDGGRESYLEMTSSIHWAFLREETATVRDNCIYFEGLEYYSDVAKSRGYFSEARHNGRYKIPVKRIRDCCDHLWHKTREGDFIRFDLVNTNNGSPFKGLVWECADHVVYRNNQKKREAEEVKRQLKAKRDEQLLVIESNAKNELNGTEKNNRKSVQSGIRARKEHQKKVIAQKESGELRKTLEGYEGVQDSSDLIDLDKELYNG